MSQRPRPKRYMLRCWYLNTDEFFSYTMFARLGEESLSRFIKHTYVTTRRAWIHATISTLCQFHVQ